MSDLDFGEYHLQLESGNGKGQARRRLTEHNGDVSDGSADDEEAAMGLKSAQDSTCVRRRETLGNSDQNEDVKKI